MRSAGMTGGARRRREYAGVRIAYLLPDPGIPVGGTKGASVHVDAICGAMARHGASVTLYAPKVVGPLRSRGSEAVDVIAVEVGPIHSGDDADRSRIDAARRFFDSVGGALDASRPDWVHERLSLFAGAGTRLAAERGLPRIVEVNAPVALERITHFGLRLVADAHEAERDALRSSRVIAVSGPLTEWAKHCGAADAVVISNGADTGLFDPDCHELERSALRDRFGFDTSTTVVGFVGSLKPWHGVELLVDAVAAAATDMDVGLLIVGDGPRRDEVRKRMRSLPASMQGVVTGAIPSSEVPCYLAATDVAVAPYLPSDRFYFSPLKVVEAMAAGLPVIASEFAPIRELVGETGILVPPGDVGALSSAIRRLAGDPAVRVQMGRSGRARAVARLDWLAVAARTLDVASGVPALQPVGP